MTEVTATAPHADRYGRTRAPRHLPRKPVIISAAVLLVLLIIAIAVYAFRPQTTPTTAQTQSYSVVDSSETLVTVGIFPDHERDVHCIVQATNEYEAIVGFSEVVVPADPAADKNVPTMRDLSIATTQLASSGHADTCWFE